VGGALLLVGYLIGGSLLGTLENKRLAALVDPFGLHAQSLLTQYWSIAEKNVRLVPFTGLLLANRALWLGVAAVVCAFAYRKFRFSYGAEEGAPAAKVSPAAPVALATPIAPVQIGRAHV